MPERSVDVRAAAIAAVMTALVFVLTRSIVIPIPVTRGFFNLSDVGVFFAGFAFGPWVGFLAGGLGTALADLSLGYGHYAPWSFVAHGVQGFVAGLVTARLTRVTLVTGWLLGSVVMTGTYFAAQTWFLGFGLAFAIQELVVANVWQVLIGGIVAGSLVLAVRRAYPPIERLRFSFGSRV